LHGLLERLLVPGRPGENITTLQYCGDGGRRLLRVQPIRVLPGSLALGNDFGEPAAKPTEQVGDGRAQYGIGHHVRVGGQPADPAALEDLAVAFEITGDPVGRRTGAGELLLDRGPQFGAGALEW
jgi:hypothetical protein